MLTPERLEKFGEAAFGVSWKSDLAGALTPYNPSRAIVTYRIVQRWVTRERGIPDWVEPAVRNLARRLRIDLGARADKLREFE
jgi:hypothetical protein